jgi:hypothetical protein
MIGDEAARKRRILEPERNIIEMLLYRELAKGRDTGVVNLDFVDGLRRLRQRRP